MHTSLIIFWAGSITLFELSHYVSEKPLYEQGFILIPHLAALAFSVGPGGELTDVYSFFVIGVLHLICSGTLALGGLYHAIVGPSRLEETSYGYIFAFQWQDRFRITAILGSHLGSIGLASLLLFIKSLYLGGLYDTWASGGGDVRTIKDSSVTLNPYVIGRYLIRAPFGSEGWIISINNLEDFIGGHYWVPLMLAWQTGGGREWFINNRAQSRGEEILVEKSHLDDDEEDNESLFWVTAVN